jgi:hypothetical protein
VTDPEVALDGVVVAVRGLFNAAIFSPEWMLHQGLIGISEHGKAEVELITREIAVFSTGWLNCQVTPDTLRLSTTEQEEFERVRDAAVGILNALPHTPVVDVTIGREIHFKARDLEQYHAIGDKLAPKEFWEPLVALPVTRDLTIWALRPDNWRGRVQVQVQPSVRFQQHVFVSHVDLFALQTVSRRATTREESYEIEVGNAPLEPSAQNIPIVKQILESEWKSSINRANEMMKAIARIQ